MPASPNVCAGCGLPPNRSSTAESDQSGSAAPIATVCAHGANRDRAGRRSSVPRIMGVVSELRSNAPLLLLLVAGTAAGLVLGAVGGQSNWPVYLVVVAAGTAFVVGLQVRYGFTMATRVGLVLFALGHVAGGMLTVGGDVLYHRWLVEPVVRYDNLQHAWGFGFVGRALWEVLGGRLEPEARTPTIAWWVVVLAAGALGALNEIVEWVFTLTTSATNVGGYDNTARDLVANFAGGILVGSWTARRP